MPIYADAFVAQREVSYENKMVSDVKDSNYSGDDPAGC